MKQIDRKYLCYWCLGCTGQAEEGYIPRQRCRRIYAKQTRLARKMEGGTKEKVTEELQVSDILKVVLQLFNDIDKRQEELSKEQSVADTKQDEILHYIEIHNLNAATRCKVISLLKKVREERRQIKNELDVIRSLKDSFIDKYKSKFIEKDIMIALKNLKELEGRKNNPKYTYKYLTEDLEILEQEGAKEK